jgi:hypothetical protein
MISEFQGFKAFGSRAVGSRASGSLASIRALGFRVHVM